MKDLNIDARKIELKVNLIWSKHVQKELYCKMPDECKAVIDGKRPGVQVGWHGDLGWYVFENEDLAWSEKDEEEVQEDNQGS